MYSACRLCNCYVELNVLIQNMRDGAGCSKRAYLLLSINVYNVFSFIFWKSRQVELSASTQTSHPCPH